MHCLVVGILFSSVVESFDFLKCLSIILDTHALFVSEIRYVFAFSRQKDHNTHIPCFFGRIDTHAVFTLEIRYVVAFGRENAHGLHDFMFCNKN